MRRLAVITLTLALSVGAVVAGSAAAEDLENCHLGQDAYYAGDHERAVGAFTLCIESGDLTDFNLAAAYFNRGNAHADLKEFELAIEDYDRAIAIDSGGSDTYANRGLAYANLKNYRQAILDFNEAIRRDPRFSLAYHNRCLAYALQGDPDRALRDCDRSLDLVPDNPLSLDSRALVYWLLGDHDRARKDLETARRLNPAMPDWRDRFQDFEQMF